MNEKILFVDDDPNILAAYRRQLRKALSVETAEGALEGLKMAGESGPFAVVIADMHMPVMNGVEFLARIKQLAPQTVRMMLTGDSDMATAVKAVNEGNIFRFLTKPCPPEEMAKALVAGIGQYRLLTAERELLEKTLNGSINLLTEVLSMVDPEAFGQAIRLREPVRKVALALELSDTWDMELAVMLCNIGLVTIPSEVLGRLRSGQALSKDEKEMMEQVPEIGQKLLAKIPRLESVARIVLYQHKQFDGSGFPYDSVSGEEIPTGSRIIKVVGDSDELEQGGLSKLEIMEELRRRKGWYDPRILEVLPRGLDYHAEVDAVEDTELIDSDLQGLRLGDLLVSDITTHDARLLIGSGNEVTQMVLARLRNHARVARIKEPIRVERKLPGAKHRGKGHDTQDTPG